MDSWKQTARNINIKNEILTAELKTKDGNWVKNRIKYTEGDRFHNIDGYLSKIWIPAKIFQTHKSQDYISSNPKLSKAQNSWKKWKNFEYFFYSDKEQDEFMKTHFGHIYDAYSKLIMPVMKADLWRYCVVYHYGGLYTDSDTVCLQNPSIFLKDSYLTTTLEHDTHFCQWTFSAPPKSPILKKIIDKSVERIRGLAEFKGEHLIHWLTGPELYTEMIEEWLFDSGYSITEKCNTKVMSNMKIHIFERTNFNNKIVRHLYSGGWENGWLKERDRKLK